MRWMTGRVEAHNWIMEVNNAARRMSKYMKEEEEDVLVVTEKAVRFPGGGHQSLLVMLQFRLGHVSGSFGRFSHLLHHPTCEESAQKKGKKKI